MELIEIDENLFKLFELMLTFSKMFHGDFKRQIMKQPWTKKQKFCFWTKRPAKNKNKNNTNETPSLDLALRAGKNQKSVLWENINTRKVGHTTGTGISHSHAVI